jgi:hypothetical protein
VQWNSSYVSTLGITINNGESVKSGSTYNFKTSHTFDQSEKITRIVTTIAKNEWLIMQINFFSGEELLCTMGERDYWAKRNGGRVVTFEIAADEQLIGAELYNTTWDDGADSFKGVTWLKMKIAN